MKVDLYYVIDNHGNRVSRAIGNYEEAYALAINMSEMQGGNFGVEMESDYNQIDYLKEKNDN